MPTEGFPRGKVVVEGGGRVSKRDRKGDEDQLFKSTKRTLGEDGTKLTGKKKKGALTGEEERVLAGRQKIGERGFDIQQLTYETITEGLLTLGTVSSIRENQEVIVSLPGRTVGSIALADVNRVFSSLVEKTLQGKRPTDESEEEPPSLSSIFFVGQTVVVRVESKSINKEGKTRIRLSSCPSKVNGHGWVSGEVRPGLTLTGALISEGDKAWEVDTGINGVKGFLQKSKVRGDIVGDIPLSVGRLLFFYLDSCGGSAFRKNVQLSLVDSNKDKFTIPDDMPLTYTQLLPGMSFREVVIMESHKTGIKVHLHDDLTGLLWQDHYGPDKAKGEEGKHKAQVLKGVRVLYVNPLSVAPTPYLTMQKKAVPFSGKNRSKGPSGPPLKLGDAVEVIVDTIQKRGVLVRCAQVKGIVPAGRLSDNLLKKADTDAKKDKNALSIGQKRKCLIVGYSEWDELFIGSFQESLLQGKNITTAGQLKAGQILKNATVLNWSPGGALMDLTSSAGGSRVKAFLPRSQIPPSVKPLESKYPEGSCIPTVRVTEVNESKCHVIVTALNALVKSKGAIIESYDEIAKLLDEGTEIKSHGLVKEVIKDHGVTVRLLGGTIGFIPKFKMGAERRETFAELKSGQVVEVNVISIVEHKGRRRMTLAFVEDVTNVSQGGGVKRKKGEAEVVAPEEPPAKKSKQEKAKKGKNFKSKTAKENQPKEKVIKPTVPPPKKILRISEEEDSFDFSANTARLEILPFSKAPKRSIQEKQEVTVDENEIKQSVDKNEKDQQNIKQAHKDNAFKLSEEQLRQSLRVNPRDGDAWVKLTYLLLQEAGINDDGGPRAGAGSDIGRVKKVVEDGISALSGFESPHKVTLWATAVTLESTGSTKGQDTSDAVQKKLNEGMKAVDPVELILKTSKAFERMKDYKNAESVYKRGLKMDEKRVPSAYARMLYAADRSADAANVFKSIVAHAKDPLKLAVEQGSLELQLGDKQKGLDLYNIVLAGDQASKMKKRCDLLTMILNAVIKHGSKDEIWLIFEKIIDLSIPALRLRGLLKRMKEYEDSHGTPESQAKFKDLALKVVSSVD